MIKGCFLHLATLPASSPVLCGSSGLVRPLEATEGPMKRDMALLVAKLAITFSFVLFSFFRL